MMRFTKRIDYGLMAMQDVAAHHGDGTIGLRRIAEEFGSRLRIPPEWLAKILQRLAKAGLMTIQSGPGGGCRLSLPPSEGHDRAGDPSAGEARA